MSSGERYGIAAELFAVAFGVVHHMIGELPLLLGWLVVVGCVITGIVLIIRGRQGRNVEQKQELDSQIYVREEIQPSSWKGLSDAEFAQLEIAFISVKVNHGHTDPDGLIDDLKNKKPLNGPCWRCGKPRFGKGGPLK